MILAIKAGHRYGFDIMDATGLPDGAVYPVLRRIEDRGVLKGRWENEDNALEEGRPSRRYYEITRAGTELVHRALERAPLLRRMFGLVEDAHAK